MVYEVSAVGRQGKRIHTDVGFKTKAEAQEYAKETNKYYPGANARVIKGSKNK